MAKSKGKRKPKEPKGETLRQVGKRIGAPKWPNKEVPCSMCGYMKFPASWAELQDDKSKQTKIHWICSTCWWEVRRQQGKEATPVNFFLA